MDSPAPRGRRRRTDIEGCALIDESTRRDAVAGIDGCRAGWVVATVPLTSAPGATRREGVRLEGARLEGARLERVRLERVNDLSGVFDDAAAGRLRAVGIDIPIGLSETGSRRCDLEARQRVGPRRGSVFPAPFRRVLGARTYEEANARSRSRSGVGISRQTFAISSKIAEVDELITPERQRSIVEVHPELSFTELWGAPMMHHKATREGRAERLDALRRCYGDLDELAAVRFPGASPDDVLDALVVAWTARRLADGHAYRLGGERDARGLRMEIVV